MFRVYIHSGIIKDFIWTLFIRMRVERSGIKGLVRHPDGIGPEVNCYYYWPSFRGVD